MILIFLQGWIVVVDVDVFDLFLGVILYGLGLLCKVNIGVREEDGV